MIIFIYIYLYLSPFKLLLVLLLHFILNTKIIIKSIPIEFLMRIKFYLHSLFKSKIHWILFFICLQIKITSPKFKISPLWLLGFKVKIHIKWRTLIKVTVLFSFILILFYFKFFLNSILIINILLFIILRSMILDRLSSDSINLYFFWTNILLLALLYSKVLR